MHGKVRLTFTSNRRRLLRLQRLLQRSRRRLALHLVRRQEPRRGLARLRILARVRRTRNHFIRLYGSRTCARRLSYSARPVGAPYQKRRLSQLGDSFRGRDRDFPVQLKVLLPFLRRPIVIMTFGQEILLVFP